MHPAFLEQMKNQLGQEAGLYFDALNLPYLRGIRLNPMKCDSAFLHKTAEGVLEEVPWSSGYGSYLSQESTAGAHPLHEAGAWYIQEPSAMAPAALLNAQPGEIILDLCAAPGGKSTQIGCAMRGEGLLVCNEPVPSRAKILSRNIERLGISNALVVSADPEKLSAAWPQLFDAVLVDAPCSGEGMFRRHPETQQEWDETSPAGCAERQKRILQEAVKMVRPGGRLVYSTCTFNRQENEEVIDWLLHTFPEWSTVPFELNAGDHSLHAPEGMLHLYPHQIRGEGHFVARLVKAGEGSEASKLLQPAAKSLSAADKPMLAAWQDFAKAANGPLPCPNARFGEALISAPDLPPLKGIKVLRAGLQLGILKGKVFVPDHALALALTAPYSFPTVEVNLSQALSYQAGEVLPVPETLRGWALPTFEGLALGFGKAAEGQLKNHYPKGLRRP